MRYIIVLLILIVSLTLQANAVDQPTIKEIWQLPTAQLNYQLLRSYTIDSIKVEEIYYQSRSYKGKRSKIFGYFCYPKHTKKALPAILLVHGGGGTAHRGRTVRWAKRGYAVLSIDLPGKGEQRASSRSTGPNMDVPTLLRTKPDPSYNYLVHAVAAARNGISFLSMRPQVDPERIGMVGLSWGGVITLLTNGQDKRLKTAVNVFGAGYIPEGCTWQDRFDAMTEKEIERWYSYIDPKNFLKSQSSPILFISGTNDHCYYLPTFQKSYAAAPAPKKLYLVPNLRHRFLMPTQDVVLTWLDYKLKRKLSFPEVKTNSLYLKGKNKIIVPVSASASNKIISARLYYALGAPNSWTIKKWQNLRGHYEDGIYYFAIPTAMLEPELLFYVTLRDAGGTVASTPIRSVLKVNLPEEKAAYAVSGPIKMINIHEPPLEILGLAKLPKKHKIIYEKKTNSYYFLGMKPEQKIKAGLN